MRKSQLLAWLVAGIAAATMVAWAYPRLFPLVHFGWTLSREEAEARALEYARDIGPPIENAYVVTQPHGADLVERRLDLAIPELGATKLAASPLAERLEVYETTIFPPKGTPREWAYTVTQTMRGGRLLALEAHVQPEVVGKPLGDLAAARQKAEDFLVAHRIDLANLRQPEVRTEQLRDRTDTRFQYRYKDQVLGEDTHYGVEVAFAGDRLIGFSPFLDDPRQAAIGAELQPATGFGLLRILMVFIVLPLAAVPFLRRYHAGELGVTRGLHIMALVSVSGMLLMAMAARSTTQGFNFGFLTRAQTTWVWGLQLCLLFFLPLGLVALLSWSVGESFCRERWGHLLAAFDALFQGRWGTATVARSALRGTASGLLVAAASCGIALLLQSRGLFAGFWFNYGPWFHETRWPGIALLLFIVAFCLYGGLFGRLFLLPFVARRLGVWVGGALVVAVSSIVLWDGPFSMVEQIWAAAFSAFAATIYVILFVRYDLLTSLVASATTTATMSVMPLLLAQNSGLQFQGSLALLGVSLPLLVSVRHIFSGEEFTYRYDDVPPHVRRIAERERQRVELETARNIQSSILPNLPPQLSGVEIAHKYLPATEVGGDFYDVLALEDGRLAVAVGDVAGHGVASGLVMSMAKSALAVQVTFNPAVEAVFATLNRMVYQTARKRLLATLCYAVIDPKKREMLYASAGHLFPYRVSSTGQVEAYEASSYPLGVREPMPVVSRLARFDKGDSIVLYSDGIVEARREGSEEDFGFARLEKSLTKHAGKSPAQLRDGILGDVDAFTRGAPREDDVTLLVLRMP
ncbi:MAG: PP2C family protein-serine/threonine phosphatase [Acidobacteriota bacterium]